MNIKKPTNKCFFLVVVVYFLLIYSWYFSDSIANSTCTYTVNYHKTLNFFLAMVQHKYKAQLCTLHQL
jgi:hypothetical protein